MDSIFLEGWGAFISAVIVFCGSVWLLMTMVMGVRLAYFVTASVTLAFVLMMGVVWSINPLGPVGDLAGWTEPSITEDQSSLEGPNASSYPESPWQAFDEEDEAEQALASELESSATNALGDAIEAGDIEAFEEASDAVATEDSARHFESDGVRYGAIQLEPAPEAEAEEEADEETSPVQTLEVPPVPSPEPTPAGELPDEDARIYAIFELDPGDPLGQARMITLGSFVLLVLHLFGLGASERRSKRLTAGVNNPNV
jgi:hypothetical protein